MLERLKHFSAGSDVHRQRLSPNSILSTGALRGSVKNSGS
jgi:hypothetical protein